MVKLEKSSKKKKGDRVWKIIFLIAHKMILKHKIISALHPRLYNSLEA